MFVFFNFTQFVILENLSIFELTQWWVLGVKGLNQIAKYNSYPTSRIGKSAGSSVIYSAKPEKSSRSLVIA